MLSHQAPLAWFALYDEWLALYGQLRQGIVYREGSIMPYVLQQWYAKVPLHISQSLQGVYDVD